MAHIIPAATLDAALSDVSDVPIVDTDYRNGSTSFHEAPPALAITFSGNYEPPLHDLLTFLAALPEEHRDAFTEPGEERSFTGYVIYSWRNVTLDGTSKYVE